MGAGDSAEQAVPDCKDPSWVAFRARTFDRRLGTDFRHGWIYWESQYGAAWTSRPSLCWLFALPGRVSQGLLVLSNLLIGKRGHSPNSTPRNCFTSSRPLVGKPGNGRISAT